MRQLSGTGRHGGTQITCAAAELLPEKKRGERGSPCLTERSDRCSATAERGRSSGENESKNGARTGEERPRRSSGSNGDGGALRVRSEGDRARERGLRGANGSEGGGGRGRALLVADRDTSTLPHARHVAARLCRRATAARCGLPRANASAGTSAGAGKGRVRAGRAGFGQRARSEAAAC